MSSRLITLAIHTYERAVLVKSLLESEGVHATLQNVNLERPSVSSGVRVRIEESDLPLALRIIENAEIFTSTTSRDKTAAAPVLVPTDFSEYSERAGIIAFEIAKRLKAPIAFLHSYIDPLRSGTLQLSNALNYDTFDTEERAKIEMAQRALLDEFTDKFKSKIKSGEIPPVKYTAEVVEGVPEESILEYAKLNNPPLIVMGTRGSGKKEKELIGSVTAEVLDSCRVPAFTIPESLSVASVLSIRDIVMFSNLEQPDILVLDTFYRLFPDIDFNITIIHVPGRREKGSSSDAAKAMIEYCRSNYPRYNFELRDFSLETVVDDFKKLCDEHPVQLIVVPNKKRNVFARLFNPSVAHKLLFHADIPMMVIPV